MFSLLAPPFSHLWVHPHVLPLRGIHPSHSFSPDLHPSPQVLGWPNSSFCKMIQKNPNFLVNPILTFCNSFQIQIFPSFSLLYPFCYLLTPTTTFLSFNSHNISSHFLNWWWSPLCPGKYPNSPGWLSIPLEHNLFCPIKRISNKSKTRTRDS